MPDDTSPHGGEAMHPPPDRAKIPQPKPGAAGEEPAREEPRPRDTDIQRRPALPEHPEQMAVDVEDEEADPVRDSDADSDADADTGKPSVTRQPGG